MSSIPRVFHFVYGLRTQSAPFPFLHYLCLKSCLEVNRPQRIEFHTMNLPWGEWWERIAPSLEPRRIDRDEAIDLDARYATRAEGRFIRRHSLEYAHQSDFLRLEILLENGGVYADIDTLFVEPIPEHLYEHDFVMAPEGLEASLAGHGSIETLGNALMMSAPESAFAQRWYERMFAVFDGTWNRHSCVEAALVARENPREISVVPTRRFFAVPPTREGIARLFLPSSEVLTGVNSLHLWEHLWESPERRDFSSFHGQLVTPAYVAAGGSLYARLASRFL